MAARAAAAARSSRVRRSCRQQREAAVANATGGRSRARGGPGGSTRHGRVHGEECGRVCDGVDEEQFVAETAKPQAENPLAAFGTTEFSDWKEAEFTALLDSAPMGSTAPATEVRGRRR